jgi:penicillin-binding protein 1A
LQPQEHRIAGSGGRFQPRLLAWPIGAEKKLRRALPGGFGTKRVRRGSNPAAKPYLGGSGLTQLLPLCGSFGRGARNNTGAILFAAWGLVLAVIRHLDRHFDRDVGSTAGMRIFRAARLALFGLLALAGLGVTGGALFLGYCVYTLPLSRPLVSETRPAAITYATAAGHPLALRGAYRGEKLTADHLPPDLVNAVVAIEDRRFFSHGAVDLHGILRAGWHDFFDGGAVEGGSTITQQLARLTYLSPERTLRRKVQEAMVAMWLEARLSKKEILAKYLNDVYFGAGAYGADAAAKRYFGKTASQLDLAQAAMLAGLIRSPSQLAPSRNPEAAHRRAELVLQAMVREGVIDETRAAAARAEPVQLAVPPDTEAGDNYFIDSAASEVKRLVGSRPLDLSVTTTLDTRLQDAAESTVNRWLDGQGARRHFGQAALVAMAPDGAILAMVGGRDYDESQFNRATQAHRQPGSLFKIFVYLTALSNGYGPDSVVVDQPIQIGNWQPANYDGHYHGSVTLRTAFAQSLNSVSAQLIQAVGVKRVIELAKSLGVHSPLPAVPSLALGSAEVTLLEMTSAMDAIATDRKSIEPYTVRTIRTEATPLYARPATVPDRPDWNWAEMMHLLEAVVSDGTGRAARLDRRSAGKTGTTDDYRDAWFVGFTSDIVVGVWVGNDDDSPMDRVVGGDIPAKIWHDFVAAAEPIMAKPNAPTATPLAAVPSGSSAPPSIATPTTAALNGSSAPPSAATPTTAALSGSSAPQSAAIPPQGSIVPPPAPSERAPPQMAPSGAVQSAALSGPSGPTSPKLRGVPIVVDTATLLLNGELIHLDGITGQGGAPGNQLARYIGGRPVACEPAAPGAAKFRCKIGDYDLGEAILLNGGARTTDNASERLRGAEEKARLAGRGVWER